jgi:UDP-N-acetylmuramyl pentapeptide phosphotransferase/UDP-N-acetylglucosamine-1-phosphate transferase
MLNFLIFFAVALGVTHLAMPLAMILGRRMNAWDAPDDLSHGKHVYQVVRTGGVAIFSGVYAGLLAALFLLPEVFANRTIAAAMVACWTTCTRSSPGLRPPCWRRPA